MLLLGRIPPETPFNDGGEPHDCLGHFAVSRGILSFSLDKNSCLGYTCRLRRDALLPMMKPVGSRKTA